MRVPAGAAVDLAGKPAEVPYCRTRPDDEASDSDSDDGGELLRPIPYLERDGPLRGTEGKMQSHRRLGEEHASRDDGVLGLRRSFQDSGAVCGN